MPRENHITLHPDGRLTWDRNQDGGDGDFHQEMRKTALPVDIEIVMPPLWPVAQDGRGLSIQEVNHRLTRQEHAT